MSNSNFKTIALVGRSSELNVLQTCAVINDYLRELGVTVIVDLDGPFTTLPSTTGLIAEALRQKAELVIAIGGDGTMLHAASLVAHTRIPLVGVNRGRLGFLADIGPDVALEELGGILAGRYVRDSRMLLQAQVNSSDGQKKHTLALNDIVVQKFDVGRMVEVEVHIDDTYVNTHRGDGLIITTPTGSTAYALSGGGPIMAPGLDAIAMVPICPHTLSDRPVVVPADGSISIRTVGRTDGSAQIMADGILLTDFAADDTLVVTRAVQRVNLLHPSDYDYFRILRSKLSWGRRRTET